MGMKERGGRMETRIIPNVKTATLRPIVNESVEKGSTVSTDEMPGYNLLKGDGYLHGAVDHSRKEWAWTDHQSGTRFSTNGTESFWKLFKDSVNGTHIHISAKHLDRYLSGRIFARCGTRCLIFWWRRFDERLCQCPELIDLNRADCRRLLLGDKLL
jgi:hypothetical protein